jgi:hypothetical protein
MQANRIDRLEEEFRPESDGVEDVTLRVVFEQTYFDEHGERCQRTLPATYDESTPYREPFFRPDLGRWQRWRVLEPIEETADDGAHRDSGVTTVFGETLQR